MKFLKHKILGLVFTALFLISCDNYPSLQQYYVNSKENNEFIAVDIPSSILQLKDTEINKEQQQILNTIKKVNFLALQLKPGENEAFYNAEKAKVKEILKNPKFKQLARMNMGTGNFSVNYLGEDDAIDEVILFGSDKEKGFALVRVLGDDMKPEDIMKLVGELKLDGNSPGMQQLGDIFGNLSK